MTKKDPIFDPEKLHSTIRDLKEVTKSLRVATIYVHSAMSNFKMKCEHRIVRCGDPAQYQTGDSARCQICGDDFGWWCPKSPNHQCDYPEGEEQCRYCGEPDERK